MGAVSHQTMRALRIHAAGDLRLDEVPVPVPTAAQCLVAVELGGICGSDVHYWRDGSVGASVLRAPMILGHEVVGRVLVTAADGTGPPVDTRVAVDPSQACGSCPSCRGGHANRCPHCRYLGSAARWPHTDGGFAERLAVAGQKLVALPPGLDRRRAALAEPTAIALHAAGRVAAVGGSLRGARVLVVGAGPIGLLLTAIVRDAGAAQTVVTDVHERPLRLAADLGADLTPTPDELAALSGAARAGAVEVDVAFECSGSPAGLAAALACTGLGGVVVSVGQLPAAAFGVAAGQLVTRELTVTGSLRLDGELPAALDLLARQGASVDGVVTHVVALADAAAALAVAADPAVSSKVLLDFTA